MIDREHDLSITKQATAMAELGSSFAVATLFRRDRLASGQINL